MGSIFKELMRYGLRYLRPNKDEIKRVKDISNEVV